MTQKTRYKLIESNGHIDFERTVEKMLQLGWKLQGGPFVSNRGLSHTLYQAMINTEKVEEY